MVRKCLLFLFIFISTYDFISAQAGEWTWMKGSSTSGAAGTFGTQGVPDDANVPPALYGAGPFTDKDGNFWMFGGYIASGTAAALWRYDVITNQWTWMKGPNTSGQTGVYGTQGIPNINNYPGSRGYGFPTWTDTSGNFWLFGGNGIGASNQGILDDLWKYDVTTNEWAWMKGSNNVGISATYGTKGVPAASNDPGSRSEVTSAWVDSKNRLWMYGGYDFIYGIRGDLWMYDISTNMWTWMAGGNLGGESTDWGTQGVFSATNTPGARLSYAHWIDASDHLWLYGGGWPDRYADLWEYDITLGEWAWMSGADYLNDNGDHGVKCATAEHFPKARSENRASFIDCCGNFWLYGGGGADGDPSFNDLWIYEPLLNQWTWISGDSTNNPNGNYGTQGTSSPTNKPRGKTGTCPWIDMDGNLWFFGGSHGNWDITYNDLWRYVPDSACHGCTLACNAFLPIASISSTDTSLCQNSCIDFFDLSLYNPVSWQWSFPGGNPSSSTLENPTNICYDTTGTYDVTLIVTNALGSDTILLSDFITVSSPAYVSVTQINDTLFASYGTTYQWFSGGDPINGATNSFYVPSTEGEYVVTITNENGCPASDTIFFIPLPVSSFVTDDPTICQKFCMDYTDLTTNNPTSWQWFFPGASPASSTEQNPGEICYNVPGSYDVTLITTNSLGTDTLILFDYITVYETPPFPTITQNGYTLTSSAASTYQWQLNATDIPGATNQSYDVLQTGFYTVVVSDANGCKNSSTLYVQITGIAGIFGDANCSIYPNPSSGSFTVELQNAEGTGNVTLDIVNTLGQRIYSSSEIISVNDWKKEIDLNDITRGVYFLEIKKTDLFLRKKIIITE